jgi:hypothetical protein
MRKLSDDKKLFEERMNPVVENFLTFFLDELILIFADRISANRYSSFIT